MSKPKSRIAEKQDDKISNFNAKEIFKYKNAFNAYFCTFSYSRGIINTRQRL